MPNLNSVLKAEITRLARKEIKGQMQSSQQVATRQRRDLAALRKEVRALQSKLTRLQKTAAKAAENGVAEESDEGPSLRFSARSVKAQRRRLNLSAQEFARLVGVSAQTIYLWESGRTRPRQLQLEALAAVRSMGKRAAKQQLNAEAAE
ncbi:MAG: helix-turn-helix transcriptional regulator [Pirellulaceae bacterium]|nr:helix-turn-helix transcriptional regulator [Pirellulaceae bacterium]